MADKAAMVIGVEAVAPAVEDARRNAEENGILNARFLCADAAEAAAGWRKRGSGPMWWCWIRRARLRRGGFGDGSAYASGAGGVCLL